MLKHLKVQTDFTKRNKKVNKMHRAQTVKKIIQKAIPHGTAAKAFRTQQLSTAKVKEGEDCRGIRQRARNWTERRGREWEERETRGARTIGVVDELLVRKCHGEAVSECENWRMARKPKTLEMVLHETVLRREGRVVVVVVVVVLLVWWWCGCGSLYIHTREGKPGSW